MKKLHKARRGRTSKVKETALNAWKKDWERKYEKDRKNGRFIREDGIC